MANYNISQIVYSGKEQCLASFYSDPDGKITPCNVELNASTNKPGDWGDQNPPYQQIVLNNEGIKSTSSKPFEIGHSYYLELDIPKDDNFSMDFALLLIPQPKTDDLDQLNYQFIRYLHVPQGGGGSMDQSRVVLYQKKNNGEFIDDENHPVKVAIAQPAPEEIPGTYPYDINSLYYKKQNEEIEYMWTEDPAPQRWDCNQTDYGYNDIILSHSWKTSPSESSKAKFQLIFTPRASGMSCLYLYLIPTKEDNDIQWSIGDKTYYGRHVKIKNANDPEDLDENLYLTAKLYEVNNLLIGDASARHIGVWGRSELMLSINGEEVKIGPSNYYELQNFAVTHLGVAAQSAADRFTIDIQY